MTIPTHRHRRSSKHRPPGSGTIVRRFSVTESAIVGRFRIVSADGRVLAAGSDEAEALKWARGFGDGARVESKPRRRKAA